MRSFDRDKRSLSRFNRGNVSQGRKNESMLHISLSRSLDINYCYAKFRLEANNSSTIDQPRTGGTKLFALSLKPQVEIYYAIW